MDKTIAVEIERAGASTRVRQVHPPHARKLLAHDEAGEAREGDTVSISPCRPMSRRKSWQLVDSASSARQV